MKSDAADRPPKLSSYSQSLVAFAAILVSVCALAVSAYQAKIMRDTQRATVWPYIEILPSNNEVESSLGIYNKGIGPALIKAVSLNIDGKSYSNWDQMIDAFSNDEDIRFVWSTVYGRVLAPDEVIKAIQLKRSDALLVGSALGQMAFEICYCSVYKECWITNLSRSNTPVSSCVVDKEHGFFQ